MVVDLAEIVQTVALPLGLGLLGFIEPCSVGSSVIFVKAIEGRSGAGKMTELAVFAITRAVFIGGLGVVAVLLGGAFLGVQRAGWIALGALYVVLGTLYLCAQGGRVLAWAPRFAGAGTTTRSIGLGALFGLNIPACAAPLILVLLGAAGARGATGGTVLTGFVSLSLFGLALSLPLVPLVLIPRARRALDWFAGLSRRLPLWAGLLLVALGLWSIGFGFFAGSEPPR